jgi:hypothetical protein
LGDAPPRPRRPRRAVHQHNRRPLPKSIPGDLPRPGCQALQQCPPDHRQDASLPCPRGVSTSAESDRRMCSVEKEQRRRRSNNPLDEPRPRRAGGHSLSARSQRDEGPGWSRPTVGAFNSRAGRLPPNCRSRGQTPGNRLQSLGILTGHHWASPDNSLQISTIRARYAPEAHPGGRRFESGKLHRNRCKSQ